MKDILYCLAICALVIVLSPVFVGRDDSDSPTARSGMTIYRDELTGCEYLGTLFHGMTPRMGADGKQVCRK
jgi:hypothetical protein